MLNGEATCSDCLERRSADGYCERLHKHVPRKKVVTKEGEKLCGGFDPEGSKSSRRADRRRAKKLSQKEMG